MGLFSKLQNGDTQLKSLKFGKDRPGGGDSGQPYIQNPINRINSPANTDFLLRGGINAPIDAVEDVARLTKYMFSFKSPSGLLFIAKQNLLSRVAVPNEAAQKWGSHTPGAGYAAGALNAGVYTPLSTLLQAGVGFTGTHLNLMGINPFSPMTGIINESFLPSLGLVRYEDVVKEKNKTNFNNLTVNFPIGVVQTGNILAKTPLIKGLPPFAQTKLPPPPPPKNVNIGIFHNRLLDLWYNKNFNSNSDINILQYGGGPGSVLGIGKTKISFADNQRTGVNNPLFITNKQYFIKGGKTAPTQYITSDKEGNYTFTSTLNYNNLLGASIQEGLTPFESGVNDDGQIFTLYSPEIPYATLSKYNPTGMSLTGSGGYQIGVNPSHTTQPSDAVYSFPIEDKLLEYKRQLLSPILFDTGNTSGDANTWAATSQNQFINKYSSYHTLTRDYTNEDVNKAGGGLWKDFNDGSKTHQEGYLADLDKNAGSWKVKGVLQQNQNNAYPGGIAPDFRKTSREKRGLYTLPISAWNDDFSSNNGETYSEYLTKNGKLQKNTLQRIYYSSDNSSFANSKNPFADKAADLITFRFGIMNPGSPSTIKYLTFRAYIDSLSDAYSADWKPQTYMGRAEKFYKYDAFSRDISLSFTVVAHNENHLKKMYSHLNTLAASLAPTYTKFGYMAGNLHTLTIGNYVYNQMGVLDGMSYEITEDSPWEITPGEQLPHFIKVTGVKFTPIHNFRPEMLWDGDQHSFINQ